MTRPALILASTSPYRCELLSRLKLSFEVRAPAVDEQPLTSERPADTAVRLALAKALTVARNHPDAVVIGSDQVADLDGEAIGKPGGHVAAVAQLRKMRGRRVVFQTAVAVVRGTTGSVEQVLIPVIVQFRRLSDAEIERYLRIERPYDCAGSAKVESLGITLLESVESTDPTALIGLPLIATCALLRRFGIDPLATDATDDGESLHQMADSTASTRAQTNAAASAGRKVGPESDTP